MKSDLIFLKSFLTKNSYLHTKIKLIEQKGSFTLIFPDDFNFNYIKSTFIKESIPFLFLENLLLNQISTLTFNAEHYISYSSLHRKYPSIKKLLGAFDLSFVSKPTISLLGEEKQIRLFLFYFFWHSYDGINWPPYFIEKQLLLSKIKPITDILYQETCYYFNSIELERYALVVALMLHRISRNNLISNVIEFIPYIKNSNVFSDIAPALDVLYHGYGLTAEEKRRESIFSLALFKTKLSTEATLKYNDSSLLLPTKAFFPPYQLTFALLKQLKDDFNFTSPKNRLYLINNLVSIHFQALHFQVDYSCLPIKNVKAEKLYQILEQKFNSYFATLSLLLEDQLLLNFKKNKDFLLQRYFDILRSVFPPKLYLPAIHIKIISYKGESLEKLIGQQLLALSDNYNISVEPTSKRQNFDIIMTDTLTPRLTRKYSGLLFTWNDILSPVDYQRLKIKLDAIEAKKKLQIEI
ncbi:MAG: helix-turn-helix domain-containing protein [Culicoidibacterales bacterium]